MATDGGRTGVETQDRVINAARQFRTAIVAALPLGDAVMDRFPAGTCGDVSVLLGQYFADSSMGSWTYRSGMRDDHSHAWIQCGRLIADITADQFVDVNDEVVVTRDRTWHAGFSPIAGDSHPALIDVYDDRTRQRLRSIYERILVSISQP
jgi:hypothetical protein